MADESKELQFKLTTLAELSGAQSLALSLEQQIGKAKALKQDYSALQEQLDTVRASINEANVSTIQQAKAFDDVAYQAQVTQEEIEKLGQVNQETGERVKESREHHRAFEMTMLELNNFVPGLGDSMFFLASGYRESAAAAEAGAVANESFIMSMGPLAVILLTIQLIVQKWHEYEEAVKKAAEQATESFNKMEDSSRKALTAFTDFQNALKGGGDSPTKKYQDDLDRRQQIVEALHRQQQSAQENAEQEALAGATTPEQQELVKRNFSQQKRTLDLQQNSDTNEQQAEVLNNVNQDIADRQKAMDQLRDEEAKAIGRNDQGSAKQVADQMADAAKAMKELTDYARELQSKVGAGAQVQGVNQQTYDQTRSSQARTTFETAIHAGLGDYGSKLSADQQAAYDLMNKIFESAGGSLKPVLDYLKQAHLNQQQLQAYVTNELNLLKTQLAKVHSDSNASY